MATAGWADLEAEPEANARTVVGPIVVGIVRPIIVRLIIGIRPVVGLIVGPIVRASVRASVAISPVTIADVLHPIFTGLAAKGDATLGWALTKLGATTISAAKAKTERIKPGARMGASLSYWPI